MVNKQVKYIDTIEPLLREYEYTATSEKVLDKLEYIRLHVQRLDEMPFSIPVFIQCIQDISKIKLKKGFVQSILEHLHSKYKAVRYQVTPSAFSLSETIDVLLIDWELDTCESDNPHFQAVLMCIRGCLEHGKENPLKTIEEMNAVGFNDDYEFYMNKRLGGTSIHNFRNIIQTIIEYDKKLKLNDDLNAFVGTLSPDDFNH